MSTRPSIDDIIERHVNDYQWGDDTLHGAVRGAVQDVLAAANIRPDTAYIPVPRCDQCRFWRPYESAFSFVAGLDLHECVRQSEEGAKFEASASGGAPILTDADFGCVQIEAKDGD